MHPNEMVLKTQMKMIVTIICEYPEQTLWSLIAVMKSENPNRSFKGHEILGKLKVLPNGNLAYNRLQLVERVKIW
jgi:hypothetical protein